MRRHSVLWMIHKGLLLGALAVCPRAVRADETQFDFNDAADPLKTSFGPGVLTYYDGPTGLTSQQSQIGTVESFGASNKNAAGQPVMAGASVMHFPQTLTPGKNGREPNDPPEQMGYKLSHNMPLNGAYEDPLTETFRPDVMGKFSLVMDVMVPQSSFSAPGDWFSYVTFIDPPSKSDASLFLNTGSGDLGNNGDYPNDPDIIQYVTNAGGVPSQKILADTWYRITLTSDMDQRWTTPAPEPPEVDPINPDRFLEKGSTKVYIDGVLADIIDPNDSAFTEYTFKDYFTLFADEDDETKPGYVGSVYFTDNVLTADEVAALGGPSAAGIKVTSPPVLLGDMNGDNAVNNLDIAPFSQALTDRAAYDAAYPGLFSLDRADINHDTSFNNLDISPFAQLLTGGAASAVPEPSSAILAILGLVALTALKFRRSR